MSSNGPPGEGGADLLSDRLDFVSPVLVSFLYGFTVILSVSCLYYLWRDKGKNNTSSRPWFYIGYTVIMFCLGTLHTICLTRATQLQYVDDRNFPGGPLAFGANQDLNPIFFTGAATYNLTECFADALLLWRVIVVYTGTRYRALLVLPCLLYLATFAMSIVQLIEVHQPNGFVVSFRFSLPYFCLAFAENLLMSGSIVLRLLVMRRRQMSIGNHHASPYVSVAAMVIESAALLAVFNLCFIVPYIVNHPIAGPFLDMLGQIQIIAPLLIIYRVSRGRAWDSKTNTTMQRSTNLRFATTGITYNSRVESVQISAQTTSTRVVTLNASNEEYDTYNLKDMKLAKASSSSPTFEV